MEAAMAIGLAGTRDKLGGIAPAAERARRAASQRFHRVMGTDSARASDTVTFSGLHLIAAGLFLAAGAEAALGRSHQGRKVLAWTRWSPLAIAPLASAAHVARAVRPGRTSRAASRWVDAVAIVAGAAAVAGTVIGVMATRSESGTERWLHGLPPLLGRVPVAPVTFGVAGIMGMILDNEEKEETLMRRRLERRASIVERLFPPRRARIDRIVIRV
jgi:hypothetical protein